ncbi:hypothetical protein GGD38_003524 [Chitinophagaceae bacterium OAS944]|nr:hypothetical protein [Chitinophagaceae bacterium OAS944]
MLLLRFLLTLKIPGIKKLFIRSIKKALICGCFFSGSSKNSPYQKLFKMSV